MVSRLIPRLKLLRWGGSDLTGDADCEGWVLGLQWLGLIVELAGGVVGPAYDEAEEPGRSYVTGGDE